MRIWDIEPSKLCRPHLLGEHRELHALWTIITQGKGGYRNHPETKRWIGREKALFNRHEKLVKEMEARGYKHHTPLDVKLAIGLSEQDQFVHTFEEQVDIIRNKKCMCRI